MANMRLIHLSCAAAAGILLTSLNLSAQAPAPTPAGGQPEFIRQGQALLRDGKLEDALALYRGEMAASPGSVAAHNAAGAVLDLMGRGNDARATFARAIEISATPADRASAQRRMAMSYAFESDCPNSVKYQQQVFDHYVSVSDFFMQGEMANEVARVCIEAGDLDAAQKWYQIGHDAGLKDKPERTALWNFRWEHAQGRLAARRNNLADAQKHIAAAKALLDSNPEMAKEQAIFYPYLTGYVAFHTGDFRKALAELEQANPRDPFIQVLIGQAHEKLGNASLALEYYRKASTATAHNPPTAFARPFAMKKLSAK